MTQERDDWKDSYARDIDFVTDKSLETIAALTQERDEALLGYGRVLNTLQFYKQKFEDPDEMLAAATEIATENSRLTQERDALAEDLENSFPDSWDGFMAFLDRAYPVDVPFISLGSDPGPQIVRLSRALATLQSRNEELSAVIEEARAHCEVNIKFYYAVGMGDISAAYEGALSILAKAELTSLRTGAVGLKPGDSITDGTDVWMMQADGELVSLRESLSLPEDAPRCIIRPDDAGLVDDVVIENVTMFRLERMDKNAWWMACYFGDDRICLWAHYSRKDGITFTVNEEPATRQIVDDSGKSRSRSLPLPE
jgi:hypothetical protein